MSPTATTQPSVASRPVAADSKSVYGLVGAWLTSSNVTAYDSPWRPTAALRSTLSSADGSHSTWKPCPIDACSTAQSCASCHADSGESKSTAPQSSTGASSLDCATDSAYCDSDRAQGLS